MTQNWAGVLQSPLSPQLLQEELPFHYIPPKFNLYDETRDPIEHIYHFCQLMALADNHEGLLCRVFFPLTFKVPP